VCDSDSNLFNLEADFLAPYVIDRCFRSTLLFIVQVSQLSRFHIVQSNEEEVLPGYFAVVFLAAPG